VRIAVTGYKREANLLDTLSMGFDEHVLKPPSREIPVPLFTANSSQGVAFHKRHRPRLYQTCFLASEVMSRPSLNDSPEPWA
jgi:hypothetical protein